MEKLFERFNVNISYLFEGKGEYFCKSEKDKSFKPGSVIDNIGDVVQIVEEMKWAIGNIPVVKFALLEYYLSYLFKNHEMIKNEVEKYRQKKRDGKNK